MKILSNSIFSKEARKYLNYSEYRSGGHNFTDSLTNKTYKLRYNKYHKIII
jgi:hypothetical protein